jgi:hypothetical protein
MSSGQGSVANNEKGGHEVYRGTKAALNTYMRSYAARHADGGRAFLLLAPGWIRTELGGPRAPLTMEEAIPNIVSSVIAKQGKPGLEYLDRKGKTVPWLDRRSPYQGRLKTAFRDRPVLAGSSISARCGDRLLTVGETRSTMAGPRPPGPVAAPSLARLHLRLPCHFQCVVDLDPEITHRAL